VIRGWPHDGGLPTRFRTEPNFLNDVNGSDMMLPLTIVFVTIVISGVIRSLLLYVSTRVSFVAKMGVEYEM